MNVQKILCSIIKIKNLKHPCLRLCSKILFLPPVYVVRREGNSFTLLVCPHLGGGVPISHNPLQHYPECHGADTWGGYPARSSWGGGTLLGGYPARGRGYPTGGGYQVGQHREYLLHGGRYASCVHAGGLSCLLCFSVRT